MGSKEEAADGGGDGGRAETAADVWTRERAEAKAEEMGGTQEDGGDRAEDTAVAVG